MGERRVSIRTSLLAAGLAGLLLAGCATGMRGSSRRVCADAGFQPGTSAFTDCWHRIRDQQFAADAPAILLGFVMVAAANAPPPAAPARSYPLVDERAPQRQCIYWTPRGRRVLLTNGICPPTYGE